MPLKLVDLDIFIVDFYWYGLWAINRKFSVLKCAALTTDSLTVGNHMSIIISKQT